MSTNSGRHPGELKSLIEKANRAKLENDELAEIDKAWKRIEKTEIDVLQTRLAEQVELVEFYKTRGDGFKKRIVKLEKSYKELNGKREDLAKDFDRECNEKNILAAKVTNLNEETASLNKIISEKLHVIDEITSARNDLNNQLEKLKNESQLAINGYEKKVSNLIEEVSNNEKEMKRMRSDNQTILADLKRAHENKVRELSQKIEGLEVKNAQDTEHFQAQIGGLNAKIDDLNIVIVAKNNKISKMTVDVNKKENTIYKYEADINNLQFRSNELKKLLAEKENDISLLNEQLIEKAKEINQISSDRAEKVHEIENLNSNLNFHANEITSLKYKIADLELKIKEINAQLVQQQAESEEKAKKLTSNYKELNKKNKELIKEIQQLNKDKSVSLEKCISFQEMIQELYGETIKLKENPINKRLEFDLSESSKRYEELFEEFIYYKSYANQVARGKSCGLNKSKGVRTSSSLSMSAPQSEK